MFGTYYMQVLSLGFIWTFFHCSGMCGPLVAGLTSRSTDPPTGLRRFGLRARRVLAYQFGRAVTYAAMGATAGTLGSLFEGTIREWTAISGFVIAPAIAGLGVWKLSNRTLQTDLGEKIGGWIASALRTVRRATGVHSQILGPVLTGMALGLLPCVLMFWTLGVAATTASPLHGAGVMVTLVLLTTPTLVAAGCAASIWRIKWSERAIGIVLLVSSAWMLLVAVAANGFIDHADLTFRLGGEAYMIMFF